MNSKKVNELPQVLALRLIFLVSCRFLPFREPWKFAKCVPSFAFLCPPPPNVGGVHAIAYGSSGPEEGVITKGVEESQKL